MYTCKMYTAIRYCTPATTSQKHTRVYNKNKISKSDFKILHNKFTIVTYIFFILFNFLFIFHNSYKVIHFKNQYKNTKPCKSTNCI